MSPDSRIVNYNKPSVKCFIHFSFYLADEIIFDIFKTKHLNYV